MSTQRYFFSTLFLSALLAGFCIYVAIKPAEVRARSGGEAKKASIAYVSHVAGDAWIHGRHKAPRQALQKGRLIFPGDVVETGIDGQVELVLRAPEGRLRLDRETSLELWGQAHRAVATGGLVTSGSVWASLSPDRRLDTPFVLDTQTVRAAAKGTVFRVHQAKGWVRVSVYDGTVATSPTDGAHWAGLRDVTVGQALKLLPGQAPVLEKIDLREDWSDGWQRNQAVARRQSAQEREISRALIRELHGLNPELYVSVEVELQGKEKRSEGFQTEQARIRTLRIRSDTWDDLAPAHKVALLNETFDVLKHRYPNMAHAVVLKFDDGRPDLALKYAMSISG